MREIPIHLGVLLAVAVGKSILGAIWYSPLLFGPRWMKLVACPADEMKKRMPVAMVVDLVLNFVLAFVLVHAVRYAGATGVAQGAAVGFFNWLGFFFVQQVGSAMFEKRPWGLAAINGGFQLLALAAMGAVLARLG